MKVLQSALKGPYGVDAYFHKAEPSEVLIVEYEDEIDKVLQDGGKICMRGAGTGYAGATVPLGDEVVLVTTKLDYIQELDPAQRAILVGAGVPLQKIREKLSKHGFYYPPDPASFKVCTIGGTVATNAGGPHCFLYGVTSNYVKRIKSRLIGKGALFIGAKSPVSLPYDLKDLMIGSAGMLGIFTEIELGIRISPPSSHNYFISFDSYEQAITFITEALKSNIEPAAIDMSTDPYVPGENSGKGARLLISLEGGDRYVEHCKSVIDRLAANYASEVKSSASQSLMDERADLIRKNVRSTIAKSGRTCYFLFDAVVARDCLKDVLSLSYEMSDMLGLPLMNTFHAGDGNIHPTLFYDPESQEDLDKVKAFWYTMLREVNKVDGAISGEHGVGLEKRSLFTLYSSPEVINAHRSIKTFFDPENRLCPEKMFVDTGFAKNDLVKYELLAHRYGTAGLCLPQKQISHDIHEAPAHEKWSGSKQLVRYLPAAFPEASWQFALTNNLPNIKGYYFPLSDLFSGGKIVLNGKDVEIGKKVIKNVSGFSLKMYLACPELNGQQLKTLYFRKSAELSEPHYILLKASASPAIIEKLLSENDKLIVDAIVSKKGAASFAELVIYNDSAIERALSDYLNTNRISFTREYSHSIEPLPGPVYVATRKSRKFADISSDYTFILGQHVYILPSEQSSDVQSVFKPIWEDLEAIRKISLSGSEMAYSSSEIRIQQELLTELVQHLNSISLKSHNCTLQENVAAAGRLENEKINYETKKCSQCGLCLYGCPKYQRSREDHESPRGIIYRIKAGENSESIRKFCRECKQTCKQPYPCAQLCTTGVDFASIIEKYGEANE